MKDYFKELYETKKKLLEAYGRLKTIFNCLGSANEDTLFQGIKQLEEEIEMMEVDIEQGEKGK